MNFNLFENKEIHNNFIEKFIEELKNGLKNTTNECQNRNEKNNELDKYNIYEKKKIYLDNKSKNGNDLTWVMDDKSVCLSEHGDGGPYALDEINLPPNVKVGEVYEKINGKYIYNPEITIELNKK